MKNNMEIKTYNKPCVGLRPVSIIGDGYEDRFEMQNKNGVFTRHIDNYLCDEDLDIPVVFDDYFGIDTKSVNDNIFYKNKVYNNIEFSLSEQNKEYISTEDNLMYRQCILNNRINLLVMNTYYTLLSDIFNDISINFEPLLGCIPELKHYIINYNQNMRTLIFDANQVLSLIYKRDLCNIKDADIIDNAISYLTTNVYNIIYTSLFYTFVDKLNSNEFAKLLESINDTMVDFHDNIYSAIMQIQSENNYFYKCNYDDR